MPSLLVIDDEPAILHAFRRAFDRDDVTLFTAETGGEGLETAAKNDPDVIVLDVNLPDFSGLDVFRRLREVDPRVPVIFITGHGTTETAIEAMKLGAFDYLLKPLELAALEELVGRAFEISRLTRVPARTQDEPAEAGADVIVGRCPPMQEVYKTIGRVAPQDVTVLILGETGTGKELVARAIYQHSRRSGGPFLAVNCAAIPEALLESELFGHEKGAFTGADRRRIGKFEQCHGGTLFLDEIGDMTPLTQAKILRVLQDKQFERVGGNETIKSDVRVIAATNRDLKRMIEEETYRSDLYYRLSVFTICLPPLRERGDDVSLLVRHFLRRFAAEFGKEVSEISPEALDLLRRYPWPGNLRELQSVVKQALLVAAGPVLLPEFLPESVRESGPAEGEPGSAEASPTRDLSMLDDYIERRLRAGDPDLFADLVRDVKHRLLTQALRLTGGNQLQAARLLGVSRSTLRNELKTLGITVERSVSTAGADAGDDAEGG